MHDSSSSDFAGSRRSTDLLDSSAESASDVVFDRIMDSPPLPPREDHGDGWRWGPRGDAEMFVVVCIVLSAVYLFAGWRTLKSLNA